MPKQKMLKNIFGSMNKVTLASTNIEGLWATIISVITITMSIFHLYYNSYGMLVGIQLRAIHLAFVLGLIFLLFPIRKGKEKLKPSLLDILLAVAGVFAALHMNYIYNAFANEGLMPGKIDFIIGGLGMLMVFEATRRAAGLPLVILSAFFLIYARFGNYFPGGFKIVPFSTERIIYQIFYTETGIFGTVLGVSATFIFIFILFGAFLGENKSSEFFNDISLALAGHRPGGPGKVAVLSSAIMGSISGSAVANVATTGTITIPLMKRVGYKPNFAAAVEAVASSGGSIMPPVMASAAFIMAEILGVSYLTIITAAIIPAILYYLSIWVILDLEARKQGLHGLPKEQLPQLKEVLINKGHLAIPLIFLIYLLITGRTPLFAGVWGIITTIVISAVRVETRLSLGKIMLALRSGALASLSVAIACAIVGIIVGVASMTGLGTMMAGNIIDIAHGNKIIAMILTMLASLILGMGLPTAACYITAAVVAAPALIKLGILPIAAHLFVLYYAVLSNLTPPVALASFTAAGIADSEPNKTAMTGLKLGLTGFIVPMMFANSTILLLQGDYSIGKLILTITTAVVGVVSLGAALEKYFIVAMNRMEQVLAIIIAILMIKPGLTTDIVGLVLLVICLFSQIYRKGQIVKKELPA